MLILISEVLKQQSSESFTGVINSKINSWRGDGDGVAGGKGI